MDTLDSPQGSENTTAIVILVAGESRNDAIIYSAGASNITLRDASGVKVYTSYPYSGFYKRVPMTRHSK